MKKPLLISITILCLIGSQFSYVQAARLTVVASVFPLFDFAREVAGPDADVKMLLPAGVEPHSWEPKPSDIVAVSGADIFLYVSEKMEPWAHSMVTAVGGKDIVFVQVMDILEPAGSENSHGHPENRDPGTGHEGDPHFWLDLSLSARTVEMIGTLFAKEDPGRAAGYTYRARSYARRLEDLDHTFSESLKSCRTRKFVTGGHSAFGYLARRYGLDQISLYGVSPDSEPTPARLVSVSRVMRQENLDVVFFEEMVNPRLARVLASETGATTMVLNPAGNLTADRMNQGATLFRIMEENLQNLRKGLHCE